MGRWALPQGEKGLGVRPPASFACLTNAADLAHKGAMKRNSPTRAVNIGCGIIISS
jgi:hypothetical protein